MAAIAPTITPAGCCVVAVMAHPIAIDAKNKASPTPLFPRCKMSGFMESLSFLFLIGLKIPQLFDEVFHCEAAGPGARRELAHQLA